MAGRLWVGLRTGLGALAVAGALAAGSSPAAAASKPLGDQDVFGIVKTVTPTAVVISHITTGRVVRSSTLTYSIAGASLTAPSHWVLEKDRVLADMLQSPFWKKLAKSSSTVTALVTQLLNPSTPVDQSKVWVNRYGPVSPSYLAPGDVVYGVSSLSPAAIGQRELAGQAVPLSTVQDETNHTPAPPATLAEKIQNKLFALALGAI
jgi:hypothetical protein